MITDSFGLGWFAYGLLTCSLSAALIVLCTHAVDFLLRQRSASVRHMLWLSAAAGVLSVPLLSIFVPGVFQLQREYATSLKSPELPTAPGAPTPSLSSPDQKVDRSLARANPAPSTGQVPAAEELVAIEHESDMPVEENFERVDAKTGSLPGIVITSIWLIGALVTAARLLLASSSLASEFRRGVRQHALFALTSRLGAEHGFTVVASDDSSGRRGHRAGTIVLTTTDRDIGPLVWGGLPARLLLPTSLLHLSSESQAAAVCHELAHVTRGDEWVRRFLLILRVTFWFHPLVRHCCNQVQLYAEFACDDSVLARGYKPSEYSELLLNVGCSRSLPISLAMATSGMAQSQLARRVVSILHASVDRRSITWLGASSVAVFMAILSAGVTALRPETTEPDEAVNIRAVVSQPATTQLAGAQLAGAQPATRQPIIAQPTAAGRILSFPTNRVVGTVETRPKQPVTAPFSPFTDWVPLGPAKGNVAIPPNHEVKLWVSADGANDMSFLTALPADSVYGLDLWRSRATDNQMPFVAHLTGLRFIRLEDTRVTGKGMLPFAALINLQRFDSDAYLANHPVRNERKGADETFGIDDESARIFLSMPSIKQIHLRSDPITSRSLAILTQLKQLESLSLMTSGVTDDSLEELASLPALQELRFGVYADGANITDAGAAKLIALQSLRLLDLSGTKISKAGLAKVAQLRHLEQLRIGSLHVEPADLEPLKESSSLKEIEANWSVQNWEGYASALSSIRTLEKVGQNVPVTPQGLKLLLTLPRLRELSVFSPEATADFAGIGRDLAQCANLEQLWLQRIGITDQDLLLAEGLNRIRRLSLLDTNIRGPGLAALAHMPELISLSISSREEVDLTYMPELPQLTSLALTLPSLPDTPEWYSRMRNLETAHISALVRDRDLPGILKWSRLKSLGLKNSALADSSAQLLTALQRLEYLSISGGFTSRGLSALRNLPQLKSLWVRSPYFGQLEVKSLERVLETTSVNVHNADSALIPGDDGFLRSASYARVAHDALEGKATPPLQLDGIYNVANNSLDLKDYQGRVVLIDFWASWCQPCVQSLPKLQQLRDRYSLQGFEIISVHESASGDAVPAFLKENVISWPVGIDDQNKSADAYHNAKFPCYYLIDRRGQLRIASVADIDLEAAIERLLAE